MIAVDSQYTNGYLRIKPNELETYLVQVIQLKLD